MKKSKAWVGCLALLVFCLCAGTAAGADKVTVRALGSFTQQIQSTVIEIPFYKKLQQEAGDRLDIQFRTMDELGQKGFQALRQLRGGVFDIIQIQLGYISGDDPYWQGLDLMGVASDLQTAKKLTEAYWPTLDKRLQEKFNGKLLALWPYGTQVFYFRDKVSSLDDFKGKKIRVFSRPMAEFVQHFGATGVTLPFPEVYTSMERGVIDGAISGALAGNTASWFEVAKYLYPLPMGFGLQAHAASLDFWNKLSPENRNFLTKKFKDLDDEFWQYAAVVTEDGYNCNTGKEPCTNGKKGGKMTLVQISAKDFERMKKAAETVILPNWAKGCDRVDADCSKVWNETAGKVVGMKYQK